MSCAYTSRSVLHKVAPFVLLASIPLVLAGCGGGDIADHLISPARNNSRFDPRTPQQTARHGEQAPIVRVEYLHVGADVVPQSSALSPNSSARGITISQGYVSDGQGRGLVAEYLKEQSNPNGWYSQLGYIPTFPSPPSVRLVWWGLHNHPTYDRETSAYDYEEHSFEHMDFLVRAVQIVNAALPYEWRMSVKDINESGRPPGMANIQEVPTGEILVEFVPREYWPGGNNGVGAAEGALAPSDDDPSVLEIRAGHIWVDPAHMEDDPERERMIIYVLVHELLHALGFREHVVGPVLANSAIGGTVTLRSRDGVLGHVIYPLDREALLATYSHIPLGTSSEEIAENLQTWSSESFHMRGDIDALDGVAFGIALRNGFAQPWAQGPSPGGKLVSNRTLEGIVGWDGLLRGIDRETMRAVEGLADLDVNLGSLADRLSDLTYSVESFGRLQFSDMKYLSPSGQDVWKTGGLEYNVVVQGNTFLNTDGDDGVVSGAFFGPSHEGMGGTLEREDLAAAFGGSRLGGASADIISPNTPAILHNNGSVSENGITTYRENSSDLRFSGYFFGVRNVYSYDDWGVWATLNGETLFAATINNATPLDPPFVLGLTNSYVPLISGTPSGSNPVGRLNSDTWLGKAFGYEADPVIRGAPVEGDVQVKVDFFDFGVEVRFDFTSHNEQYSPSYSSSLQDGDGTFRSRFWGDRLSLDGTFYGPNHEGVAGTFKSHQLEGVFGAIRQ